MSPAMQFFSPRSPLNGNLRTDLVGEVFPGSLKSGIFMVAIAKTHKLDMGFSEDSPGGCQGHLLFHSSSRQLRPIGLEANIDAIGITFADRLFCALKEGRLVAGFLWISLP